MQPNSSVDFFDENERRVNQVVVKLYSLFTFAGPVMLAARYFNIFPKANYTLLFAYTLFFTVSSIFLFWFIRRVPYAHYTKYITLGALELLVIFLSIMPGISVFILYVLVPVLSCMYYKKHFTYRVIIACYIMMIASLYIRSRAVQPYPAGALYGIRWFITYGSGSTLEYIFCVILSYNVVSSAHESLQKQYEQDVRIRAMQTKLIEGFANLVESKDYTTGEHVKRTSEYVRRISLKLRELGHYTDELTDDVIDTMTKAAPLHDLGKISIPEDVLSKPGPLTKQEFEMIRRHPLYGASLIEKYLSGIETDEYTETARSMTLGHHEWWNGEGYPRHVSGTDIPLAARIMAAADVLDALLSKRPYKEAFSVDETLDTIKGLSGKQFDPKVVQAVEAIRASLVAS